MRVARLADGDGAAREGLRDLQVQEVEVDVRRLGRRVAEEVLGSGGVLEGARGGVVVGGLHGAAPGVAVGKAQGGAGDGYAWGGVVEGGGDGGGDEGGEGGVGGGGCGEAVFVFGGEVLDG